ncbi:MAG: GNAT family N-acetyltransferase [Bacteroidota bacterium]
MQDMLVRLYDLPDYAPVHQKMEAEGISIRPALAAEKSIVAEWTTKHFGKGWASEVEVAFSFQPVACLIAIEEGEIRGFACYEAAYKNFFGPTGVEESQRGRGIGKALLMKTLMAMRDIGYAYAIIGGVGPAKFYEKAVGAKLIEGSNPGIYKGILSHIPEDAGVDH